MYIVIIRCPVKAKLNGTKPIIFKPKIKIKRKKIKGKNFWPFLCLIFSETMERILKKSSSLNICHLLLGII